MATAARWIVGSLCAVLLFAGGIALVHAGIYGWTIFVLSPVILGGLSSWVSRPATGAIAASRGALTAGVSACLLLVLGIEGLICIVMALPLVMPLGALGGWLAHYAESSTVAARGAAMLLLLPAATLTWDTKVAPPLFEVRTEITVSATPEEVWKHVVAFSPLPEPDEWFFRIGVAYPKRARIEGSGPGAIRYCEFSTGPFVEPIEVWDEPLLLHFQVTANSAPLHEWSPYGAIQPKHLHGYLIAKQGEFRLTRLANGHTLLEGTTWYQHGLWPAEYWRWWSDAIIHRIHLRVLNHVRILAEQGASTRSEIGSK